MRQLGPVLCSVAAAAGWRHRRRHHGELRRETGNGEGCLVWPVGGKRLNLLGNCEGSRALALCLLRGGGRLGWLVPAGVTGTGVGCCGRWKGFPRPAPDRAAVFICPAVRLRQSRPGAARHPQLRACCLGGHQVSVRVSVLVSVCVFLCACPSAPGGRGRGSGSSTKGGTRLGGRRSAVPHLQPALAGLYKRLLCVSGPQEVAIVHHKTNTVLAAFGPALGLSSRHREPPCPIVVTAVQELQRRWH